MEPTEPVQEKTQNVDVKVVEEHKAVQEPQ